MQSFWNNDHELTPLYEEVNKLIPSEGEVKGNKNRKLERMRKMANCYYDIFNNGGCNRMRAITAYFGEDVSWQLRYSVNCDNPVRRELAWKAIAEDVDPIMAEAIKEAAEEQGITVDA